MSQKVNNAKSLYLEGIHDGHAQDTVEKYTGDRYTQHSTGVRDGKEGFLEFFGPFIARNPIRDIDIVRAFEDGQYVFVHAYQSLNHGEAEWVTMDFFDTDNNDKIIEHWDVIAPFGGVNAAGTTQVDGATEITDRPDTEKNKTLVRSMIKALLMPNGQPDDIDHYIHPDYIQHQANMPDGYELPAQLRTTKRSRWYQDIVLLIGCGNFVASLCRVTEDGEEYAQTDLFRIQSGKIIEHWDAAEPVPPIDTLVNSGKF